MLVLAAYACGAGLPAVQQEAGIMNGFFSGAGLRRLRVMTHKELLQLFRDVALMVFFLYSFTGDIYIAASGVSMQLKNAAIATLDGDHSLASRELASRFQPPYFQAAGSAGTAAGHPPPG
jgi:ABC-2 type transport system permease protein